MLKRQFIFNMILQRLLEKTIVPLIDIENLDAQIILLRLRMEPMVDSDE